jgi:hypothetical protein
MKKLLIAAITLGLVAPAIALASCTGAGSICYDASANGNATYMPYDRSQNYYMPTTGSYNTNQQYSYGQQYGYNQYPMYQPYGSYYGNGQCGYPGHGYQQCNYGYGYGQQYSGQIYFPVYNTTFPNTMPAGNYYPGQTYNQYQQQYQYQYNYQPYQQYNSYPQYQEGGYYLTDNSGTYPRMSTCNTYYCY